MSPTALFINTLAVAAFGAAFLKNRDSALKALKTAWMMFLSLLPMLLIIILLIALLFAFVSTESLEGFLGDKAGPFGLLSAALLGSVLHIPSLLAFPLAASLLERGAAVGIIAAFITTLTMIGVVTLPIEIASLGKRFALLRNGLSFAAALIISSIIGAVL